MSFVDKKFYVTENVFCKFLVITKAYGTNGMSLSRGVTCTNATMYHYLTPRVIPPVSDRLNQQLTSHLLDGSPGCRVTVVWWQASLWRVYNSWNRWLRERNLCRKKYWPEYWGIIHGKFLKNRWLRKPYIHWKNCGTSAL